MDDVKASRASGWTLAALALALALSIVIGWIVWQMPVPIADMLQEIVKVEMTPFVDFFASYLTEDLWFFRPLEFVHRYIAQNIAGGAPFGYNLFAIAVATAIIFGFVALVQPTSETGFASFCIGLSYLVGHHGFAAGLELNIAISNLVIAFMMVLVLLWIERGWGGSALALFLSLAALATKEIGLVVPVVVVAAHWAGLRRLRLSALVAIVACVGLYVVDRAWSVVLGLGTTGYGSSTDRSLVTLLLNAISTGTNVLTGLPLNGLEADDFARFTDPTNTLWFSVRIAAAVLPVLLIVAAVFLTSSSSGALRERYRRLLLVAAAGVAATGALGFFYAKDRHGVVVLPLLAYLLCLAVQQLLATRPTGGPRLAAVTLVLAATLATSIRIFGLVDAERDLAVAHKGVWIASLKEIEAEYGDSEQALAVVRRYARFAESRRLASTMHDPPWVDRWLGGRRSIGY